MSTAQKVIYGVLILVVGGVIGFIIAKGGVAKQNAALFESGGTIAQKKGDLCFIRRADGTIDIGTEDDRGSCIRATLVSSNNGGTPEPKFGDKCDIINRNGIKTGSGTEDAYGNCIKAVVKSPTNMKPVPSADVKTSTTAR